MIWPLARSLSSLMWRHTSFWRREGVNDVFMNDVRITSQLERWKEIDGGDRILVAKMLVFFWTWRRFVYFSTLLDTLLLFRPEIFANQYVLKSNDFQQRSLMLEMSLAVDSLWWLLYTSLFFYLLKSDSDWLWRATQRLYQIFLPESVSVIDIAVYESLNFSQSSGRP